MPTTRAMARKGAAIEDDKENDSLLPLRKKPLRRTAVKSTTTTSTTTTSEKGPRNTKTAVPLSPKKITQVAKAKRTPAIQKGEPDETINKPTRVTRGTARSTKSTSKPSPSSIPRRTRKMFTGDEGTPVRHVSPKVASAKAGDTPSTKTSRIPTSTPTNTLTPVQPSTSRKTPATSTPTPTVAKILATKSPLIVTSPAPADSDDELVSGRTPMRRGTDTGRTLDSANRSNIPLRVRSPSPLCTAPRTPQYRPTLHRNHTEVTMTQRVPLKEAAPASPRRAMTVARGSNVAYVFKPLPRLERSSSAPMGPYQWPLTPSREIEDPMDRPKSPGSPVSDVPSTSSRASLRRTQTADRTPVASQALRELFTSTSYADEDSDDENDDEDSDDENDDEDEVEPEPSPEAVDHSYAEQSTLSKEESAGSSLVSDFLPTLPSRYSTLEVNTPLQRSGLRDDSTHLDSPTLGHVSSTPAQQTPVISQDLDDSSEDELCTPMPTKKRTFDTSRIFKTPHMRSALESFERRDSTNDHLHAAKGAAQPTVCIDPALIIVEDVDEPGSVQRKISFDDEINFSPFPKGQTPKTGTPLARMLASPEKICDDPIRLSLLLDTDALCESSEGEEQSPISRAASPHPMGDLDELSTPDTPWCGRKTCEAETEEAEAIATAQAPVDLDIPHYAQSTITSVARRKSMPSIRQEPQTPQEPKICPPAQTTVKAKHHGEDLAKLWREKMVYKEPDKATPRSAVRRCTLEPKDILPSRPNTPSFLPRSKKSLQNLRRTRSDMTLRTSTPRAKVQDAPQTPATIAFGARPRFYTPSNVFKVPASVQPETRSFSPPLEVQTPMKQPLKTVLDESPVPMVPFTPHPSAPLKSVVALVEVFTLDGSDASQSFILSLQRLGARTTKTWTPRVTHVIFKDGSPATLQKIRLAAKDGREIFCVNSRWVTDSDQAGRRMDERSEEYAVDTSDVPRGGQRRRKSMEPSALKNLDNNALASPASSQRRRSNVRQSVSRASLASTIWDDTAMDLSQLTADVIASIADEGFGEAMNTPKMSRVTVEEDHPGQKTMPVNKVRMLPFGRARADKRRLTTWDIAA